MGLAKTHGLADAKLRKAKQSAIGIKTDDYAKVENSIAQIYVDICNGVSKSDVLEKIVNGMYENKPCIKRHAYQYYNAALSRLQEDTTNTQEELKNVFYARYEALLQDAIQANDRATAKGILDSMVKFFLKLDTPQNAIQVNTRENKVEIKFGYGSDS